jgi:hypothetical protein
MIKRIRSRFNQPKSLFRVASFCFSLIAEPSQVALRADFDRLIDWAALCSLSSDTRYVGSFKELKMTRSYLLMLGRDQNCLMRLILMMRSLLIADH